MKSSYSVKCSCGAEITLQTVGSQPFPDAVCGTCGAGLYIVDRGSISERVINRSFREWENGEFTLSVILSAMSVECELSHLYIKWKNVDMIPSGTPVTVTLEDSWEAELRKANRIIFRLDMVCEFLTGEKFDSFVSKSTFLMKSVHTRHPLSVTATSQTHFFEEQLFRKRNRIVHFGKLDYDRIEALGCLDCAVTLFQITKEMDSARRKQSDA